MFLAIQKFKIFVGIRFREFCKLTVFLYFFRELTYFKSNKTRKIHEIWFLQIKSHE